jgi:thioesterase domain-containing protein
MAEVHVATIRRYLAHSPFVLIGQSSGGLIANFLASHLERVGLGPAAVVLIDTYPPEKSQVIEKIGDDFGQLLMERQNGPGDGTIDQWGDAWITAMIRYEHFDLQPQETAAPTLFVHAQDGLPGWPDDWRPDWLFAHDAIDVPGNHFTMMEHHVDLTASAIETWLSNLTGANLTGANLTGANLTGANLTGASLTQVGVVSR